MAYHIWKIDKHGVNNGGSTATINEAIHHAKNYFSMGYKTVYVNASNIPEGKRLFELSNKL